MSTEHRVLISDTDRGPLASYPFEDMQPGDWFRMPTHVKPQSVGSLVWRASKRFNCVFSIQTNNGAIFVVRK